MLCQEKAYEPEYCPDARRNYQLMRFKRLTQCLMRHLFTPRTNPIAARAFAYSASRTHRIAGTLRTTPQAGQ
jgi:hypothetical protein